MGRHKRGGFIGSVPDGWVGCPATSTGLVDDRFFVFKTPLKHELNKKVAPSDAFSVDSVFDHFDQITRLNRSRIGLWIDLTNTSRYYDASEVEKHGVEYRKFACEGHGKAPSRYTVSAFCHLVNGFFRRNHRDYIGIHCTHGFNRTGFFICSYLIRFQRFTPEEAVTEFARFRAPGIYRQIYVDELFTMSFPARRPLPVTQPSWLKIGGVPPATATSGVQTSNHVQEGSSSSSSNSSSSSSRKKGGNAASSSSSTSSSPCSTNDLILENRCASKEHCVTLTSPSTTELEVAS